MSDFISEFLDESAFDRRAVYPEDRDYYRTDIEPGTGTETAEEEADITNNYLRIRRPRKSLLNVEVEDTES